MLSIPQGVLRREQGKRSWGDAPGSLAAGLEATWSAQILLDLRRLLIFDRVPLLYPHLTGQENLEVTRRMIDATRRSASGRCASSG
jgi:hypothetical protein